MIADSHIIFYQTIDILIIPRLITNENIHKKLRKMLHNSTGVENIYSIVKLFY